MTKKEKEYSIEIEGIGTLKDIEIALKSLAFDIETTDNIEAIIDDNNDNKESFYQDSIISCEIIPMA